MKNKYKQQIHRLSASLNTPVSIAQIQPNQSWISARLQFHHITPRPFYDSLDFVRDNLGEPVPERQNQKPIWISRSKRQ